MNHRATKNRAEVGNDHGRVYWMFLRCLIPYAAVLVGLYWWENAWSALLLYHAGMAFYLALTGKLRFLRLSFANVRAAVIFSALGLAAWPALYLLWPAARLPGLEMAKELSRFGLSGLSLAAFAVYYSTVHPLLEEMFWRFDTDGSPLFFSEDLLFAGYHMLVLVFFLKPAFIAAVFAVLAVSGMAWRRMVLRGGRLEAVLSHAAGDAATMAAALMLM